VPGRLHSAPSGADAPRVSEAPKSSPATSAAPRGWLPTQIEAIRDLDEAARQQAESELAYHRWAQDYARPAGGLRRRIRWRRRAMLCVIALDSLLGLTAALAALLIHGAGSRHGAGSLSGALGATHLQGAGAAVTLALIAAILWPLALAAAGVYESRSTGHGTAEFRRVLMATIWVLALSSSAVLGFASALGTGEPSLRALVLIAVPLAGGGSVVAHAGARIVLRWMRRRGRCLYRVVAVGMERSVAELVRATRRDGAAGLHVVGACLARPVNDEVEGVPVLGSPAEAVLAVQRTRADTVLITSWSDVSQEELRRLSWEMEGSGVQLLVAPRLSGVAAPRLHIRSVDGSPLVHVGEQEFTGVRRVAKAALDYGLSGLLLLLGLPVLAAVGVAVKLTSPGPILFRQERIGRHGESFTMHKFRSMYVDAEARRHTLEQDDEVDRGPLFKRRDDPRVTPVGRFIRRYSLDELPQLLDVFGGRMSLVGPRPPLESEVAEYEDDVRRRLRVKPGMTGLWQVSGRSNLAWEDAVRLDLHYVENWSLTADLSIMLRTVTTVLARDGAY